MTYRGFSLVEVLVAGAIAGVILIGNLHSLKFAMQAGAVSKAILTENDFKLTVSRALVDNCYDNLKPTKLTGSDHKKGIGVLKPASQGGGLKLNNQDTEPIIKIGAFKGDIEVVKMEVTGDSSKDCPDTGCKRDFVAYYKKTNLGDLNTVAGKPCGEDPEDSTKLKLGGCFTTQCQLEYTLDDTSTDEEEGGCESLTCHPVVLMAGVGGRYPCPWGQLYNPDHKTTNKPKCEDRSKKIAGENDCNNVPEEKRLGSNDTRKKIEKNGKCVCKDKHTILTAEGLCFKNFGSQYCKHIADYAKYCSRDYQGSQECITSHHSDQENQDNNGQVFYKRVYNRETGQVSCIGWLSRSEAQEFPPPSWFMPPMQ